ncbi:MAG: bifunctional folylpolyglutamate synthase/dihydrofolate synthase [Oscillospiraceae bacterium]|nr:bifunctional folylpolyglutamate synthase/dihydrofolate synthase [Oscillospiraceae bacterium]
MSETMRYDEALQYIHAVCWKGSVPGLERITELMQRLGNPEKELKFIHIVGTNGKGSTAAMLASVLKEAGYRTGLFTSPYVVDFRERMQMDGEMIPPEELAAETEAVKPFADAMADAPTEFELITAIALRWFARRGAQIVVLEAGMGGALDSTNVIPAPEAAVFTNIGLDHTEFLGDTVEAIARTKAGILKPGCAAALYPNEPAVCEIIEDLCRSMHIPLYHADPLVLVPLEHDLRGQHFRWGKLNLALPLLGEHQRRNLCLVLAVIELLRDRNWLIPDSAIRTGIAAVHWPGRFELLGRDPLFVLDGGHNPQCMDALWEAANRYLAGKPLTVITGVLADKDYASMYDRTGELATRFFTLTPPNPRALDAAALGALLEQYGKPVTVCHSPQEAVKLALAATPPAGAVLAYGSLYLAADIRSAYLELCGNGSSDAILQ